MCNICHRILVMLQFGSFHEVKLFSDNIPLIDKFGCLLCAILWYHILSNLPLAGRSNLCWLLLIYTCISLNHFQNCITICANKVIVPVALLIVWFAAPLEWCIFSFFFFRSTAPFMSTNFVVPIDHYFISDLQQIYLVDVCWLIAFGTICTLIYLDLLRFDWLYLHCLSPFVLCL
jgi:hypothetical protein